jgi:hypothetical protein
MICEAGWRCKEQTPDRAMGFMRLVRIILPILIFV